MKAIVGDWSTDIYLTPDEFKQFCKPGAGADTCIWAGVSGDGFECFYYHKPFYLLDRWEKGLTVAKRDGCDKVKNADIFQAMGKIDF